MAILASCVGLAAFSTLVPGFSGHSRGPRSALLGVALLLVAGLSSSAAATLPSSSALHRSSARAKYVSGHLNVSGFTVALVGSNGKYVAARLPKFRLRAPTSTVTMQLISPTGKYAGPVVFGGSASRVITGVKAGTSLGRIDVVASKGYAHLARKLPRKALDSSRWAYAKHGVPIGNGKNFGLVKCKCKKNGGTGPGEDKAHVGIPNEFDIAVPGTHVIAALGVPKKKGKKASRADASRRGMQETSSDAPPFFANFVLMLDMTKTVNADVSDVTTDEIAAAQVGSGESGLSLSFTGPYSTASLVELNCNGLPYCSGADSTGQAQTFPPDNGAQDTNWLPFPGTALDTSTGFGEIVGPDAYPGDTPPNISNGNGFFLWPRTPQISSGDTITQEATINGTTTSTPTVLGFVFATVPAITSWSDTAGDQGPVTYPDTPALGGNSNPISVNAGQDGHVVLTLTFDRPQRQAIAGAGEPAGFMDVGNLGYQIQVPVPRPPNPPLGVGCNAETYSNLSPALTLTTGWMGHGVLQDSASDQPSGSESPLSFTVDLTQCLADNGLSFPTGEPLGLNLLAQNNDASDNSEQTFVVEQPGA